jgi:hypothetical protein
MLTGLGHGKSMGGSSGAGPPGPGIAEGRPRREPAPSNEHADHALLTIPAGYDDGPEMAAWAAAVTHLHRSGLPAAVPELPAAWLRRRGIHADWTVAA